MKKFIKKKKKVIGSLLCSLTSLQDIRALLSTAKENKTDGTFRNTDTDRQPTRARRLTITLIKLSAGVWPVGAVRWLGAGGHRNPSKNKSTDNSTKRLIIFPTYFLPGMCCPESHHRPVTRTAETRVRSESRETR